MDESPDTEITAFDGQAELEEFFESEELERSEICLVGSMSMSIRGIREHHDIDFCATDAVKTSLSKKKFPAGIGLAEGRYEILGLSDEDIIADERYHDVVNGIKIVRPEVTLAFKKWRRRPKDERDIELLEEYSRTTEDWDWSRYPTRATSVSLISRGFQSIRNDGFMITAIKASGFVQRKYPSLATLRERIPVKETYALAKSLRGAGEIRRPEVVLNDQYQGLEFRAMDLVLAYTIVEYRAMDDCDELSSLLLSEDAKAILESETTPDHDILVNLRGYVLNPVESALILTDVPREVSVEITPRRVESKSSAWLHEQNVPAEAIEELQRYRQKLLETFGVCFYAILWPPSQHYHDQIQESLSRHSTISILDRADAELANLPEFVADIYGAQTKATSEEKIAEKIDRMQSFDPVVRVLTIELPNPKIRDGISLEMEAIKNDVRHEFMQYFADEFYYAILHTSDNFEDNRQIKEIISQVV